jgi:hypothetical protein
MKSAICAFLVVLSLAAIAIAQQIGTTPSISFGSAQVSIGMTKASLEQNLTAHGWHLQPIQDYKESAMIENGGPISGQVVFADNRVVYISYQFPNARNATELAQEIAGAVEVMDMKNCTIGNYSGHGTGGGFSQTMFKCGPKKFSTMTFDSIGTDERTTNVQIEIGEIPRR